jgi:hypothetical protein
MEAVVAAVAEPFTFFFLEIVVDVSTFYTSALIPATFDTLELSPAINVQFYSLYHL